MKIQIPLASIISRWSVGGFALILLGAVVILAGCQFFISAVGNPRLPIDLVTIESALSYFPDSAKLHARLAAELIERPGEDSESHESLAGRAFHHAQRAVQLTPENHEFWLLLAAAAELRGEMSVAEDALQQAVNRAPSDINVRWQVANLYLRTGKIEQALNEFRIVALTDQARLPVTMNLIWQATNNNFEMLDRTIGQDPHARLAMAQFLVEQSQFEASAKVFGQIDRESRLKLPGSGQLFNALLNAKQWQLAGELWWDTVAGKIERAKEPFWNGGFDQPITKSLAQFDWQLSPSNFARFQIGPGPARNGKRALTIAYLGVETTRLDGEAKHAVMVNPGTAYRLEFYAKPENLVTPDGPRIEILRPDDRATIARSDSIPAGSSDWKWMAVDFTAPADVQAVWVAIKQTPQYKYTEPTSGVIRFDDFTLKAQ